jgi:predicted nucleic acid-binding protein
VWVAAADAADAFNAQSRVFLSRALQNGTRLAIPEFAVAEVACALSRKYRDPVRARRLALEIVSRGPVEHVEIDTVLLGETLHRGTTAFLRGADALYLATAHLTGTTLVSWDNELVQRAGALTPTDWLAANQ